MRSQFCISWQLSCRGMYKIVIPRLLVTDFDKISIMSLQTICKMDPCPCMGSQLGPDCYCRKSADYEGKQYLIKSIWLFQISNISDNIGQNGQHNLIKSCGICNVETTHIWLAYSSLSLS